MKLAIIGVVMLWIAVRLDRAATNAEHEERITLGGRR